MSKKALNERDICTKFITPAIQGAGWDIQTQMREEVNLTDGRVIVRGQLHSRAQRKRADYILYHKPGIPLAVVEAKDNNHSVGAGMQQALKYAEMVGVPFAFSSNGDGFLFHDATSTGTLETELTLEEFPSPDALWAKYKGDKGIDAKAEEVVTQDYYTDGSGKSPRYYQQKAINRTVEAIAKGQDRVLLVMATGTGKTYTAFQIIWRLWKSKAKKRILFLADRNILVDQTKTNDFKPFGTAMTKISKRQVNKAFEIYLSLYQAVSGTEEESNIYKQFSPDFFDLIVIDECHRGSAHETSAWREILDYFSSATHVGLTATPKDTEEDPANLTYFGEAVYTYSLKQGIEDGFLAPYKVVRIDIDKDLEGWRPTKGQLDKHGNEIEDRVYNQRDFDRALVLEKRTELVAKKVTEFLKGTDRESKTIVFCEDIDHAERMRQALANENADITKDDRRYVMRITGDNPEGKAELDNFIDPENPRPVIATTSKLMTTGVDAKTCRLVVLDQTIKSMTEFKQIIGRGTRIDDDYGKHFFTIMDFRKATELFADPDFDGEPVVVYNPSGTDSVVPPDEGGSPEGAGGKHGELGGADTGGDGGAGGDSHGDEASGGKRTKYFIREVPVMVVAERVQYMDKDGKLITESLKDYTKKTVTQEYATLKRFLAAWRSAERKDALLEALTEQGVFLEALAEEVGKDFGAFDLICHVAFDQPPKTRQERAENVKKRNYFTKYGEKARKVLEALLDKYADEGIEDIEDLAILKVQPISGFGTPIELVKEFGGKPGYLKAVRELEAAIYNGDVANDSSPPDSNSEAAG